MNPSTPSNKSSNLGLIILGIVIVAVIVVAIVFAVKKPAQAPADMPANQNAMTNDQSGSSSATGNPNVATPSAPQTIHTTTGELKDQNSDLVTFSIASGATLLSNATATGTIDSAYSSNGSTISVELADKNYLTTKTVTGRITGTAPKNNLTFSVNLDTTGIKKGAGYIIFKSPSRGTQVRVAVVFQ